MGLDTSHDCWHGPTLAQMASDGPAIVGILNPDEDPVELFRQNLAFGEGKVWAVYLPEHPLSQWDDPQRPDHAVLAAITGNGPTSQANAEFLSWCLTHKRAIVAMERARDEACAALKEANDALRSIAGLPDDADAEDARIAALAAAEQGERDRELLEALEANPRMVGYATGCLGAKDGWTYTTPQYEVLPAEDLRDAIRKGLAARPPHQGRA